MIYGMPVPNNGRILTIVPVDHNGISDPTTILKGFSLVVLADTAIVEKWIDYFDISNVLPVAQILGKQLLAAKPGSALHHHRIPE